MRFVVESWDPAYGSATETLELAQTSEAVDVGIETPAQQWAPVRCPAPAEPHTITFVDGVRRIDVRVWIEHEGVSRPGVCATVAAGAVRCSDGSAEILDCLVLRALYAMPDGAGPIATSAGTYELVPCPGTTPEETYFAIHAQMTHLEQRVSAAAGDGGLVVVDGPLRGRSTPGTVGYVKTQHVQYLSDDQHRVVGRLDLGDRTPLFLVHGRQTRYSWYLRLPGPWTHPMSGIVRCEVPALGAAGEVAARASEVTATLQRFASEAHKDSRAPQNLYPIAGLESALRRRLGDARLMERALRAASALALVQGGR